MTEQPEQQQPQGIRSAVGLDINEVDDGLVIYDARTDRVHYLNITAGVVFALCDGEHAAADLPALTRSALGSEDLTDDEVAECIAQLRSERLIV